MANKEMAITTEFTVIFLPVIALSISKKLTAKCVAVKIRPNAPLCWCLPFTF